MTARNSPLGGSYGEPNAVLTLQELHAGEIGEFTVGQLVSLRFASDTELPALARKVLDEKTQRA
jgi:uncharacterized protein DUF6526